MCQVLRNDIVCKIDLDVEDCAPVAVRGIREDYAHVLEGHDSPATTPTKDVGVMTLNSVSPLVVFETVSQKHCDVTSILERDRANVNISQSVSTKLSIVQETTEPKTSTDVGRMVVSNYHYIIESEDEENLMEVEDNSSTVDDWSYFIEDQKDFQSEWGNTSEMEFNVSVETTLPKVNKPTDKCHVSSDTHCIVNDNKSLVVNNITNTKELVAEEDNILKRRRVDESDGLPSEISEISDAQGLCPAIVDSCVEEDVGTQVDIQTAPTDEQLLSDMQSITSLSGNYLSFIIIIINQPICYSAI